MARHRFDIFEPGRSISKVVNKVDRARGPCNARRELARDKYPILPENHKVPSAFGAKPIGETVKQPIPFVHQQTSEVHFVVIQMKHLIERFLILSIHDAEAGDDGGADIITAKPSALPDGQSLRPSETA